MATMTKRLREMMSKYGKVAVGVHVSVSALCMTGCYIAVRSSLDVEALLERVGLIKGDKAAEVAAVTKRIEAAEDAFEEVTGIHPPGAHHVHASPPGTSQDTHQLEPSMQPQAGVDASRAAIGGGGALALAFICNKALFPLRAPLTLALTPQVWKFLASRGFKV